VVYKSMCREVDLRESEALLWDYLEGLDLGIGRGDVSTWHNWPQNEGVGIMHERGVGQSKFMWHARTLPSVKKAYLVIADMTLTLTLTTASTLTLSRCPGRHSQRYGVPLISLLALTGLWYFARHG